MWWILLFRTVDAFGGECEFLIIVSGALSCIVFTPMLKKWPMSFKGT